MRSGIAILAAVDEPAVTGGNKLAHRAVSRCYGAAFFALFGGAWMALAAYAFGMPGLWAGFPDAVVLSLLVVFALHLQRRGREAGKDAFPREEQQRNDRAFGWVNAVTWIAVFLAFLILQRIGHPDLPIPAAAIIVGLHFFPMPPLYRHRANLVTGGAIAVWTVLCILMFRGDLRIGAVAAGVGLILWMGAAWALRTAARLLTSAGL